MLDNRTYITQLNKMNEIDDLRVYAAAHQVPIMDKVALEMVKQLIRIHGARSILEIGTAIGYSALQFASVAAEVTVTTIERNEDMYEQAVKNVAAFNCTDRIRLVYKDAAEALCDVDDRQYDILFIDAAKAQSKKFFELYSPLVRKGGLIITDNILYHDFVGNIEIVRSRNVKQMVRKIEQYNDWLTEQTGYTTNFIDLGDGMSISVKEF
ncbi:O-methyltransferase [Macrococcus equipercicus]|uniref:tRNA 5-hydroxyuridine methyltransferase n=1 Tax=Macrococcus equipercicus TaxID=69967 RepID=A0A9Q9F2C4_9STAP|nr:O-methyltransferase [Macrococcus equipercicus]KAA1040378.1 O-methyltransferase [Macrococcus equipercicus]UTH14892.1 O-methyltransferase [Macrococcus equipercicus]